jgi:pyridoxamine 5'-phosphate oxidase
MEDNMDAEELFARLERLLGTAKVGLLTTVDGAGFPRSRWMTPTLLRGRNGYIYAVTAPDSQKADHIRTRPEVEWTIQSTVLDEVITATGKAVILQDPHTTAEVLESIGPNLAVFWRVNPNSRNLVVVETELKGISCFFPIRNERNSAELG